MQIFISTSMVFGGVIAAYVLLAGTMQTAHDGSLLGKRWSSMWVPVRVALSTTLLLPVGTGKNIAIIITLALASMGSGIGDKAFKYLVDSSDSEAVFISGPSLADSMLLAKNVVDAATCNAIQNLAQADENKKIKSSAKDERQFTTNTSANGSVNSVKFGPSGKSSFQDYNGAFLSDVCGSVSTTVYIPGEADSSLTSLINAENVKKTIMEAKIKAVDQMINAATASATTLAQKTRTMSVTGEDIATAYNAAAAAYVSAMTSAGKSAYNSSINKESVAALVDKGWMWAGAYQERNVQAYTLVAQAMSDMPASKGPTVTDKVVVNNPSSMSMAYGGAMMPLPTTTTLAGFNSINYYMTMTDNAVSHLNGISDPVLVSKMKEKIDGEKSVSYFIKMLSDKLNPIPSNISEMNPMAASRIVGINVITITWTCYAALAVALGVSSFLGVGAAIAVMPVVAPLVFILFSLGATLAFYIPFMPLITWTFAVIGWIVLIYEAIPAVNLWAMAHMIPDGDGLVAGNKHGYMFFISVTLRPMLLLIGLMTSLSVMRIGFILVNLTWPYVSDFSAGAGGMVSVMGKVASIFIYTNMLLALVKVANNLQTQVPDQIMTWIGGGKSSLLGGFDNATGAVMDKTVGATQQAINSSSQASQMVSAGVGNSLVKAGNYTKEKMRSFNTAQQDVSGKTSDVSTTSTDESKMEAEDSNKTDKKANNTFNPVKKGKEYRDKKK